MISYNFTRCQRLFSTVENNRKTVSNICLPIDLQYFLKYLLHCFVMKGSSRNKFIHTISLSTFHVKKTSPFIKRLSISPFFALYNIKRDIKKRNTFLPLIMHSNITLMKKLQKTSPTIRTIYEICNLILRSDIVTKTKCAQKLLANICASRGPLLWVRAFLA